MCNKSKTCIQKLEKYSIPFDVSLNVSTKRVRLFLSLKRNLSVIIERNKDKEKERRTKEPAEEKRWEE